MALLPPVLGLGWGELAFGIALQQPDFAWIAADRQLAWILGAAAGLLFALSNALFWPMAFGFRASSSFRLGAAALMPALAGWLWPLMLRLPLPAPHDFPLRSLQLGAAATLIAPLLLALFFGLMGLGLSRQFGRLQHRSLALRLGGLAMLFSLLCSLWSIQWLNTGDAPHYLLMAQSLATDADTELSNNYSAGDWRRFYDRKLEMQSGSQGPGHYSLHRPGLPLLLAPMWKLSGLGGALFTLALLAALGGALLFRLLLEQGYSRGRALLGWALLSFSAPWLMHSQIPMGEMLAGLMLILVLASWRGLLPAWAAYAAAGFLFWINVRFYPAACLMALLSFVFIPKARAGLLLWSLLLAGALALNAHEFGSINPFEPFKKPEVAGKLFRLWSIPRAVGGMLLDQEYGWLLYAPAYALSFSGLAGWKQRETPWIFWGLMAVSASYLAPVFTVEYWHGDMAPARYLVFLAPLFAISALAGFIELRLRLAAWALTVAGFCLGALMTVLPWLCFSKQAGENIALKALSRVLGFNLTPLFPSFIIGNLAAWLWSLAAVFWLVLAVWRRSARPS